ncbi:MAG TPA: alpha/beta fold hydrolase, partial [Casimicrobiaceae bacterium]|nr:alpha/beta fold hydrolase [Casimicrobiaceae bacterium]
MSAPPNTHHVVGTGPHHVLVLHGWFGDSRAFAQLEPALTRTDFTYAFIDYRGYGGMRDVHGAFTMDEIASDAIVLADHLGFADFSVVGHSMGGMAAQRVLSRAPDRVRKLVAITPVPACGVPFDADGWTLFSSAADNPHNRFAIIDYTTGNRLS